MKAHHGATAAFFKHKLTLTKARCILSTCSDPTLPLKITNLKRLKSVEDFRLLRGSEMLQKKNKRQSVLTFSGFLKESSCQAHAMSLLLACFYPLARSLLSFRREEKFKIFLHLDAEQYRSCRGFLPLSAFHLKL